MYLHAYGLTSFNIMARDRALLQELLLMKLGKEALILIRHNLNTNKNEGINRGISASLPKNVNFSRTAKGRLSSAVDRMNWGAGESLHRKLEACGSPVTRGGRVAVAVHGIQKTAEYDKERYKKSDVRYRKASQRFRAIRDHYRTKAERKVYEKHQLDPKPAFKTIYKKKWDHCYSKL